LRFCMVDMVRVTVTYYPPCAGSERMRIEEDEER